MVKRKYKDSIEESKQYLSTSEETETRMTSRKNRDTTDESTEGSENESVIHEKENGLLLQLKRFQVLLKDTAASGKESIGGEATELAEMPGLFIKEFGLVPLPLNEITAERLIQLADQSPYGVIGKTIVDVNVRNSFQIEPIDIEIKNPDWNNNLKKLVDRVGKGLGCHGNIEAKLYKLLIYRKGGFFKKHTDTEKETNMFGTLIIQLPSVHEGGELVIHSTNGTQIFYDFGQADGTSQHMTHFVAHYADIDHEVLEVKSGYRLALVYSLCWSNGNTCYVINENELLDEMGKCLDELNKSKYQIAVALDHKYTVSSLRLNGIKALKGIDHDRFNLINNANLRLTPEKQLRFYIAHASLVIEWGSTKSDELQGDEEYEESTSTPFGDYEEEDRKKFIKEWYDVNGTPFPNMVDLKNFGFFTKLIDPNQNVNECFINIEQPETWCEKMLCQIKGHTGNEGPWMTTIYQRYFLVIWPQFNEFDAFLNIGDIQAIDYLYETYQYDANIKRNMKKLMTKMKNKKTVLSKDSAKKLMSIFEKVINIELLYILLNDVSFESLPVDELAKLIVTYNWGVLKKFLSKVLHPLRIDTVPQNCDLVKELYKLNEKETAFECFKYAVSPILNNARHFFETEESELFSQLLSDTLKKGRILMFYSIAKTLILFEYENNIDEWMSKYVRLMGQMVTLDDQNLLSDLLELFLKKEDYFCRFDFILKLFEIRFRWLKIKLSMNREFKWSMPGSIRDHMELDTFLRSEDTNISYYDSFNRDYEASTFRLNHGGLKKGYFSLKINQKGTTKENPHVIIEKTKEFYENEMNNIEKYECECKKIEIVLRNYKYF